MDLNPVPMPTAQLLPATEYFEVESKNVGARFAVWVTTPPDYNADPSQSYPAIYMPDGNMSAPMFAPGMFLLPEDPIHPIEPFIQITVGYCGDEAADFLRQRNRDLLPPGEPVDPRMEAGIDAWTERGVFTPETGKLYKESLRNARADAFLAFLTDELHPALARRYRVDDEATGLFGYSYGGLFAAWAIFQRPSLFKRFGAGSPGMMTPQSQIFTLLDHAIAAKTDFGGRRLHMVGCEREITEPSIYQSLGESFARFSARIGSHPLAGLAFSAQIVPRETHATGHPAARSSFLRACYSARPDARLHAVLSDA